MLPSPYQITIVEQKEAGLFNKGKLLNAGVLESLPADYYCFHDVDFYPLDVCYDIPAVPTRPFATTIGHKDYTEKFNRQKLERLLREDFIGSEVQADVYSDCFGGVILVRRDHFFAVKGYSNRFEFWGYEDLDFALRCQQAGFSPHYSQKGVFRLLPHRHAVQQEPDKKALILKNQHIFETQSKVGDFDNGLLEAKYQVVESRLYQGCRWLSIAF